MSLLELLVPLLAAVIFGWLVERRPAGNVREKTS